MRSPRQTYAIVTTGAALAAALTLPAVTNAQDTEGGVALDLTIGQSLVLSDDLDFPNVGGSSGLGGLSTVDLAFRNITRGNQLTFDLSSSLEQGGDDSNNTQLGLGYTRLGPNAQLDLNLSYDILDLDDLSFTVPDGTGSPDGINPVLPDVDVTLDNGERSIFGAELGYQVGLQDPFGLSLDLGYRDTQYTDVADPDLDDNTRESIRVQATFQIDPRITLTATASGSRRETDDILDTTRVQTAYGVGAIFDVNQRATASLDLSYEEIDTDRNTGDEVTDGLGLTFGLDYEMPNGTLSFDLARRVGVNGDISSARVGRALTLRNDADLSVSLGLVKAEEESVRPTLELTYGQAFRRSEATVNLTQTLGTDTDDEDVLRTSLSANYIRPLSEVSSLRLTASGTDSTVLGVNGEDRSSLALAATYTAQLTELTSWSFGVNASTIDVSEGGVDSGEDRFGVSIGYQRALTEDWSMTSSVRFDQIDEDGVDTINAATLSLGIERTFSFRP